MTAGTSRGRLLRRIPRRTPQVWPRLVRSSVRHATPLTVPIGHPAIQRAVRHLATVVYGADADHCGIRQQPHDSDTGQDHPLRGSIDGRRTAVPVGETRETFVHTE